MCVGLLSTGSKAAEDLAFIIARNFTATALKGRCPQGELELYEKYDASGSAGGGGEYEVQTGFGWTNGVLVEFMALFGDRLLQEDDKEELALGRIHAPRSWANPPPPSADHQGRLGRTFAALRVPQ